MTKKQTWQCEKQAKRKEAREYLHDKKGPSKFCGNTHSTQAPKELVLDMPVVVMWVNQQPTAESKEIVKRIYDEVPSVQMHQAEGEVALLILTIPEAQTSEGAALVRKAQQTWKWRTALRKPQHLAAVLRSLCVQKKQNNPERTVLRQLSLESVNILWEEQEGHRHAMTIGNAGSQHVQYYDWAGCAVRRTCLRMGARDASRGGRQRQHTQTGTQDARVQYYDWAGCAVRRTCLIRIATAWAHARPMVHRLR